MMMNVLNDRRRLLPLLLLLLLLSAHFFNDRKLCQKIIRTYAGHRRRRNLSNCPAVSWCTASRQARSWQCLYKQPLQDVHCRKFPDRPERVRACRGGTGWRQIALHNLPFLWIQGQKGERTIIVAFAEANEVNPFVAGCTMLCVVHELRIDIVRFQCAKGFQCCAVILTAIHEDEAGNAHQDEHSGFLLLQIGTDMPEARITPPIIIKTLLRTSCC
mmetsp:Transcript_22072/g.43022  ORF Transcript_22072/g.43022 Transcript_22072/m.43022 type:complete len:216 (-) Transcript_22072:196-843(-)